MESGRRGRVKDISELDGGYAHNSVSILAPTEHPPSNQLTFFVDEIKLKRAFPPLALPVLLILFAEHVQLDVPEPDLVLRLPRHPRGRRALVRNCIQSDKSFFRQAVLGFHLPNAVQTGHCRNSPLHTAACRRMPLVSLSS